MRLVGGKLGVENVIYWLVNDVDMSNDCQYSSPEWRINLKKLFQI
jgi:hypothetical protein